MNDIISIIIPVYNVERYLKRCIDSVINQTYQNLEILLIDDGSEDQSGLICDEYANFDNRIVVVHKKNGGQSEARNVGLNICRGQYILFVDSDDCIEPQMVYQLHTQAIKNSAEIVTCEYKFIGENGTVLNYIKNDGCFISMDRKNALKELCKEDLFSSSLCAKLYHKDVFSDIRFPEGYIFEDVATVYRAFMKAVTIVHINCAFYNYIQRPNSTMTSAFNIRRLHGIKFSEDMCSSIANEYPELYSFTQQRLFTEYSYHLRFLTLSSYEKRKKEILAKELFQKIKQTRRAVWKCGYKKRRWCYAAVSLFGRHALQLFYLLEAKLYRM